MPQLDCNKGRKKKNCSGSQEKEKKDNWDFKTIPVQVPREEELQKNRLSGKKTSDFKGERRQRKEGRKHPFESKKKGKEDSHSAQRRVIRGKGEESSHPRAKGKSVCLCREKKCMTFRLWGKRRESKKKKKNQAL